MVFYFTSNAVAAVYTIYMGKDKYENEDLIKYGWPEDVWWVPGIPGNAGNDGMGAPRDQEPLGIGSPSGSGDPPDLAPGNCGKSEISSGKQREKRDGAREKWEKWARPRKSGITLGQQRGKRDGTGKSGKSWDFPQENWGSPWEKRDIPWESSGKGGKSRGKAREKAGNPLGIPERSRSRREFRPQGQTMDDIPKEVLSDCAHLVKANSIQGCKLSSVTVVYTPWSNLRKTPDMDVGQIGFHRQKDVRAPGMWELGIWERPLESWELHPLGCRELGRCKLSSVTVVYTPWSNLRKTPDMDVGQIGFHRQKDRSRDLAAERECRDREERARRRAQLQELRRAERDELRRKKELEELRSYSSLMKAENMSSNQVGNPGIPGKGTESAPAQGPSQGGIPGGAGDGNGNGNGNGNGIGNGIGN
ncbi:PREDICTED: coiled-coil domain-containing protein 25, partial [Corvus brachyrhynchos]|uniref:coiled-coil domain-containing protein 25 n=1 Tax=Corvus brachyrhynchos TaxID=85066 RepID=UPI000816593F